MSPAFAKGFAGYQPNVLLTSDRFHVIKLVNEAVDEMRRSEVKSHPIPRKKRYAFLKIWENLSDGRRAAIGELELTSL